MSRYSGDDGRRNFLIDAGIVTGGIILLPETALSELANYSRHYKLTDVYSPKRRTRPNRKSTRYIILHTTEGDATGALRKLSKRGEASYLLEKNGKIDRILKPKQISMGCGRSLWEGLYNLDNYSVNIEVEGYHNNGMTPKQYSSLKSFLSDLQKEYKVSDEDVIPHSQVAFGRPNKWHRRSHRGRKRCGMLFSTEKVREKLGLITKPRYDPDVAAGKLIIADKYLADVLYSGEDPSRKMPQIPESEDEDIAIRTIEKGHTIWEYAGDEFDSETTIYLLENGMIRRGDELKKIGYAFDKISPGLKIAVGYVYGGHVSKNRTAYSIVGEDWDLPSTIYISPDPERRKIITGDDVKESRIEPGTLILFRR
ncbi:N-acetylmuramoyl-L-alanine amidase [archaeon]|nr:N-acetylmuramoyl-L-alanine amidase [archaeon]